MLLQCKRVMSCQTARRDEGKMKSRMEGRGEDIMVFICFFFLLVFL